MATPDSILEFIDSQSDNCIWLPVPSASGYFASSDGRIMSARRRNPRLMKPISSDDGHLYIFVDKKKRWVHHLVLDAFGQARPEGLMCRHLDGRPDNNNINNLCWGTALENADDRYFHGTMLKPENSQSPLTRGLVEEIRKLQGVASSRAVGKQFGVSHVTIQKIWLRERWL